MGGLREKKKKESEHKILKTSKEIFLSKGYTETTMEEIAQKAEIGVGTLYNYFKSKAEIFIAIMSEDLVLDQEDNLQFEHDLEKDVAEIVIDYMWKALKSMKIFGKKIWKELLAAMLGNAKTNTFLFKGMIKMDYRFIEKMKILLEDIRDSGMLRTDFNADECAYALYSVLLTQFILYVYTEDISFEKFVVNIENQVKFIFDGKCSIKKDEE